MKWIKLFEDFKKNNEAGDLITPEDIIKNNEAGDLIKPDDIINAKENDEKVYATIVGDIPGNDPKEPLQIIDIEDDLVTVSDSDDKIGYVQLKNIDKIDENNDFNLQSIIDSIPDSDIPSETNLILEIGDKIVYTEGWCMRCFSNYDVYDRDEMVSLAKELTPERLERIPRLPQYSKRFSGKEMIYYKFVELDENNVNYALSIGIYK